ncbi:hypothetical protein H310_13566 [Aphanomyces invadans]|uniref:Uncharacterized protein n=1 Tax=Aphanomyces invadans TaxID=157072 RepID=A0A024TEM4_9STRA|nr:hypothetical protein H310_13566 [Aphanomyces invadans]ETV92041.1 hypothetical protein H310_13566 [Aphanomyces invadans]|eukprot:XP_008879338.1 hypothetical protein H310_13566 [Aphanomyces invadans]
MEGFGGGLLSLSKHNVSAWVDTSDSGLNITAGRPVVEALGYSTEDLLKTASATQDAYDLGELSVLDFEGDLDDFEEDDVPAIDGNPKLAVRRILEQKVQEAECKGFLNPVLFGCMTYSGNSKKSSGCSSRTILP